MQFNKRKAYQNIWYDPASWNTNPSNPTYQGTIIINPDGIIDCGSHEIWPNDASSQAGQPYANHATFAAGSIVYNYGTLLAHDLQFDGCTVYNFGTFQTTGGVSLTNGASFYNVSGMVISSLTIDASSKFYTKANSNLIVSGAVNINGLLQGDPMGYAQINTNQDGVYVFSGGQLSGPVKICEQTNQGSRPGFVDPLVLFNCDPGLPPLLVQNLNVTKHFVTYKGYKYFELNNHLGNVLTTVSDRRIGVSGSNPLLIDYYAAVIMSSSDYYAFGSAMPGRSYSSSSYRYGFNGKEKDPEGMGGGGATYDYGFRIYNPNIGKFLSIDPLFKTYAHLTPYQFAANNPIRYIDLDGLEAAEPPDFSSTAVVDATFETTGGTEDFNLNSQNVTTQTSSAPNGLMFDISNTPNTRSFVNQNEVSDVTGGITPENFTNVLLGNFINGTGPENYVFPLNSDVSKAAGESIIVEQALNSFYELNADNFKNGSPLSPTSGIYGFGSTGYFEQAASDGFTLPTTVPQFIGSAQIKIDIMSATEIQISIFNITSLSSGDYIGNIPGFDIAPSRTRNGNDVIPYSNISQSFSYSQSISTNKFNGIIGKREWSEANK